jgi:HSP20 family protein
MSRHSSIRSVGREHAEEKPVESRAQENVPVTSEFGSIMSSLGSMERLLEDTFRRPFTGTNWLPFKDMFREFGRFGENANIPVVDVYEHDTDVIVKCELPGMKRDDINVKFVDNNTLVLSGERKSEEKIEKSGYLRQECTYGAFSRTLNLPEGLVHEKAKASYKDGILEIRIPKSEEAISKTWTIPIE